MYSLSDSIIEYTVQQKLFNYRDDNALINQLLAPLEVSHENEIAAKAHSFFNLSVWQNFPASQMEKLSCRGIKH
jgi:hypothetical protein